MPIYIPGLNQQTAATLAIMRSAMGSKSSRSATTRRRKRSTSTKRRTKRAKVRKTRTSKRKGKLKRLVKGSAAAKRYMAKIRRKRK